MQCVTFRLKIEKSGKEMGKETHRQIQIVDGDREAEKKKGRDRHKHTDARTDIDTERTRQRNRRTSYKAPQTYPQAIEVDADGSVLLTVLPRYTSKRSLNYTFTKSYSYFDGLPPVAF